MFHFDHFRAIRMLFVYKEVPRKQQRVNSTCIKNGKWPIFDCSLRIITAWSVCILLQFEPKHIISSSSNVNTHSHSLACTPMCAVFSATLRHLLATLYTINIFPTIRARVYIVCDCWSQSDHFAAYERIALIRNTENTVQSEQLPTSNT